MKSIRQTNKDLDLRRFGKDVYTKALKSGDDSSGQGDTSIKSFEDFMKKCIYNAYAGDVITYYEDHGLNVPKWTMEWIEENAVLPLGVATNVYVENVPWIDGREEPFTGGLNFLFTADTPLSADMLIGTYWERVIYPKDIEIDNNKWYFAIDDGFLCFVPGSDVENEFSETGGYFPTILTEEGLVSFSERFECASLVVIS